MDIKLATAPSRNIVVQAAAGTGKTWLLTSRLVRLLLAGAAPGSILAITFTRKAAGEIHERVVRKLLDMAGADDATLAGMLEDIGVSPGAGDLERARSLYETLLCAEHELRAMTFHAFCQEVLRRFPLEAEVPPGFELVETTADLETDAWRALMRALTRHGDESPAAEMDLLLRQCGGTYNARAALQDFLHHRSDWWAYTEDAPDPAAFAATSLQKNLGLTPETDPLALLAEPRYHTELRRYNQLLGHHRIATHQERIERLTLALAPETTRDRAYTLLSEAFLTAEHKPRVLKRNKALSASVGERDLDELLQLHQSSAERLLAVREQLLRRTTLAVSRAWYVCGQRLLEHYQRLKAERNLLDFADLEWMTCRLLSRGRHAEWVQFKLDQRIDHLLVDEFQDTNPTQWRLLLPLLAEMAAGDAGRNRSVFLVGDEKQSIYRFRRADPLLFDVARGWLEENARAATMTQHISWRSSPAVIQLVNLVFDGGEDDGPVANAGDFRLRGFREHTTHRAEMWGLAEMLPLIAQAPLAPVETGGAPLRNSLERPRVIAEDERHRREGDLIAARITELIGQPIAGEHGVRPLDYGDVMILLRDRNHAHSYEAALRRAGVPYSGAGRATFLDCLEVRDLVHLLRALIAPHDNLALASALRAPIFSVPDSDLIRLAQAGGSPSWIERLTGIALADATEEPLARARRLLARWDALVDRIPVHDLVDRIYNEGDVASRYQSAAPPHLRSRIEANLKRFLELALDVDSGRYPSLMHFLSVLETMAQTDSDQAPAGDGRQRVRLLTIHGAKGLEAPVVFLADAARGAGERERGVRALIEWPVAEARPRHFHLVGKKATVDGASGEIIARLEMAAKNEEANLLYVALTRAKQVLYVSGCEPGRKQSRGWYGFMEERLRRAEAAGRLAGVRPGIRHIPAADGRGVFNTCISIEHGARPEGLPRAPSPSVAPIAVDARLTRPLAPSSSAAVIHPSAAALEDDRPDHDGVPIESLETAKRRGVVIHYMLERLAAGGERAAVLASMRREWGAALTPETLDDCWREACRVLDHPEFSGFYDAAQYREARNEVPITYLEDGRPVFGVIDRLVLRDDEIIVIDYKTHAQATAGNAARLAEGFADQMRLYGAGARRLWPRKRLRMFLLFTACLMAVELPPP